MGCELVYTNCLYTLLDRCRGRHLVCDFCLLSLSSFLTMMEISEVSSFVEA
jgi:hypothetical protein